MADSRLGAGMGQSMEELDLDEQGHAPTAEDDSPETEEEAQVRAKRRKNMAKNMAKALRDDDPEAAKEVDETAADAITPGTARSIRRHNQALEDAFNVK